MSRKLLVYLLALVLVGFGWYWGLSRISRDSEESRSSASDDHIPSAKLDASKRHLSPSHGSPVKRSERVTLNRAAPGVLEAQKRYGPIPKLDKVQQLIEEALLSFHAEDRALAVSELGLLEPTNEVLQACLEALGDPEEKVRAEAALALEMLEEPAVIPDLQRVAAADPSQEVREMAAEALESLMNP